MRMSNVRRLGQPLLLGSSLVVLGMGWLGQEPHAARSGVPDALAKPCTARNVGGSYGFSGSGTILSTTSEPSASLIATVGLLTFDGEAQWRTTNQTLTIKGHMTQPSMSDTYTVQADCTFTLALGDDTAPVDAGVFVHGRQEGFLMETIEGVSVTFTLKRIRQND